MTEKRLKISGKRPYMDGICRKNDWKWPENNRIWSLMTVKLLQMADKRPKMVATWPKMVGERPKIARKWPQMNGILPEMTIKRPKMTGKRLNMDEKWLETTENGEKITENCRRTNRKFNWIPFYISENNFVFKRIY